MELAGEKGWGGVEGQDAGGEPCKTNRIWAGRGVTKQRSSEIV